VRHGLYLRLRAGFDRLHPVFTFIESHSFRHVPGCARIIMYQVSKPLGARLNDSCSLFTRGDNHED
jgi:hypothetical protein